MITFEWKPTSEIPTEHWDRNDDISPSYLVRCGEINGRAILGYANYSYATNAWMSCYRAKEQGIWEVEEWTDVKL